MKTQEGYKVLCYRLSDTDPSKVNFSNAVKAFCMFNDMMISQDEIIEGYIVVFDMKGLRLGHLAKIQLGALRTFMAYIQVRCGHSSHILHIPVLPNLISLYRLGGWLSSSIGSASGSAEEDLCCSCGGIYQPSNGHPEAADQIGAARSIVVHIERSQGPLPSFSLAGGESIYFADNNAEPPVTSSFTVCLPPITRTMVAC